VIKIFDQIIGSKINKNTSFMAVEMNINNDNKKDVHEIKGIIVINTKEEDIDIVPENTNYNLKILSLAYYQIIKKKTTIVIT